MNNVGVHLSLITIFLPNHGMSVLVGKSWDHGQIFIDCLILGCSSFDQNAPRAVTQGRVRCHISKVPSGNQACQWKMDDFQGILLFSNLDFEGIFQPAMFEYQSPTMPQ